MYSVFDVGTYQIDLGNICIFLYMVFMYSSFYVIVGTVVHFIQFRSSKAYKLSCFGTLAMRSLPTAMMQGICFIPITLYQLNGHVDDVLPDQWLTYINTVLLMYTLYSMATRGIYLIAHPPGKDRLARHLLVQMKQDESSSDADAKSEEKSDESSSHPADESDEESELPETNSAEDEKIVVPPVDPFRVFLASLIQWLSRMLEALGFSVIAGLKQSASVSITAYVSDADVIIWGVCTNIAMLLALVLVYKYIDDPDGSLVTITNAHIIEIWILSLNTLIFKYFISSGDINDGLFSGITFTWILYAELFIWEAVFTHNCLFGGGAVIRQKGEKLKTD